MPANFLIVCGGAGRGILHTFDTLGFDGALQIDVQNELMKTYDGRILQVGLPLPLPHDVPVPYSVSSLHDYLKRLEAEWQSSHRNLRHDREWITCTAGECENYKRRVNHVRVAFDNIPPAVLGNGMSQRPVIGRSYITRDVVNRMLAEKLRQLLSLNPPHEPNVTVWLVSSTCGGTGNGIVHHVADLVKQVIGDLSLKIKFIRIGAVSYRSVAPSADVATFWSVLTDYGYRKGIADGQTVDFYYIDVPDVDRDVQAREKFVHETVLALVQPHIDQQFAQLLVAGSDMVMARVGTWNRSFDPDLIYREGLRHVWAEKNKLLSPNKDDVLKETRDVEIVIEPSKHKQPIVLEEPKPTIVVIIEREQGGSTQLPPAVHVNLADVREVEQLKSNDHWRMMQQFIQQYCIAAEQRRRKQEVQINLILNDGTREKMHDDFGDKQVSYPIGSACYVARVQAVHRVMARIEHFLFGDSYKMGCIRTLQEAWNRLIPARPWWSTYNPFGVLGRYDIEFRRMFDEGIDSFLTIYFTVARSIEYYDEAKKTVSQTQRELEPLDRMIEQEMKILGIGNSLGIHAGSYMRYDTNYLLFASLNETFGGTKTWLEELYKQTNAGSNESARFRRVIMQGAIGLTEHGLKYKLQVPLEMSLAQLVALINTRVGSSNPVWWQGTDVQVSKSYGWLDIRRFPRLPAQVFTELQKENHAWGLSTNQQTPLYVCSDSLAMRLDINAVQGAIPGINEEEQITQLTEQVCRAVLLDYERYHQEGSFDKKEYIATQCTRSSGLPIRVPPALMSHPRIKEIMTIMTDYLVIDQS